MENKDPYSLLGVSKTATEKEIKHAYKRLAVKYHPDKNKGNPEAEEKFKKISWAYDILSDPKKKQAFDQFGPEGYAQKFATKKRFLELSELLPDAAEPRPIYDAY